MALEFGPPSGTGKLIPLLLDAGTSSCTRLPRQQMGFSHTSYTATHVLQHRCDQWASADAGIVRHDSPRASQPQVILKLRPPSSLDYKANHGPQTCHLGILGSSSKWVPKTPNENLRWVSGTNSDRSFELMIIDEKTMSILRKISKMR